MDRGEANELYAQAHGQVMQALSWVNDLQGDTAIALQIAMECICAGGGEGALAEVLQHAAKLRTNASIVADILADARSAIEKISSKESELEVATAHENMRRLGDVTGRLLKVEAKFKGRVTHAVTDSALRARVLEAAEGRCFYCFVEVTIERHPDYPERHFHVDHIVAKNVGGIDHFNNYVASCQRCNCEKGDRSFAEFVRMKRKPILRVVGE